MAGSRITALKAAAKDLIDEVVNDDQSPFFSRVAIAPWGTNLHAGTMADALRGPVAGPTAITGAHWRNGNARSISGGSWRVGSARSISTASWQNGSARTITQITKLTSPSPAKIRVTTSGNHGYSNGQFVRITGANGSYSGFNNAIYAVETASTTAYYLRDITNTSYITPPSGSSNASAGSSQRCYTSSCEVQVTTSSNHGFSNGDLINISGVSGMTQINKSSTTTWTISGASGSNFILDGSTGPSYGNYSSGGSASECYTATCQYVVTANSHGFSDGDYIYISGTSASGGTAINNSSGNTWTIADVTTNTFTLPGPGMSYAIWSSNGTASKCFTSNCLVKVTSSSHGLTDGDYVEITSVAGFTGANTTASQVSGATSTEFYLSGWGPGMTNANNAYSSNTGQAQCLQEGCEKYRYYSASNNYQIRSISNCLTERRGAHAATDAPPGAGAWLGRDYAGTGSLVVCDTTNYITPLTHNRTKLKNAIDNMVVNGSTAGQIGAGWAWYLLSDKWAGVFPTADHQPVPKLTPLLNRFAVLMTDGEFNTAHCNGVTTETYAYSSVSNNDRIDSSVCTASDTPFNQAQAICTAMKADNITIYTIGFEVGSAPGAAAFLQNCASTPAHYYAANGSTQLQEVFKKIGKEISKLRLTR
jgi:hypothetical protein